MIKFRLRIDSLSILFEIFFVLFFDLHITDFTQTNKKCTPLLEKKTVVKG